jgi:hypothetical protein
MKRLIFLCAFLLSVQSYAQDKPCTLETAPELRGFRLGQKLAGVREVYPRLKYPPVNEIGMVDPVLVTDVEDVSHIILRFMDGELKDIEVFYDESPQMLWTVDDFTLKAAEGLNLPSGFEDWKQGGHRNERLLRCKGFVVRAGVVSGTPYIHLESAGYDEEVTRRALVNRQRKRDNFKP